MPNELEILRAIRESSEKELNEEYYLLPKDGGSNEKYNQWIMKLSNSQFDAELLENLLYELKIPNAGKQIGNLFRRTDQYSSQEEFESALKSRIDKTLSKHLERMLQVIDQMEILQKLCNTTLY